ncbi:MAG: TetR/AcrR family transcriptional regulator [Acidobacteria bacterium]|nr:TetR/AcrR family transcriptional regulator [Acidobacteriota bacterium]MBI3489281.1 TetR/AcrR family transcriptional regulator [Acidobacteriota bacterium]
MPRDGQSTRARLVQAASHLFYREGISGVSVDAVAAKAGVTKRTLYYHFSSKDDLVAAYLEARDQPNLALMAQWYREASGGPAAKVEAIFRNLAQSARHPKWRGCAFLRTIAELASMPGHPARKAGARHKRAFEAWLAAELAAASSPEALARQIVILLDGAFAASLTHRDAAYVEAAGEAARKLVALALAR